MNNRPEGDVVSIGTYKPALDRIVVADASKNRHVTIGCTMYTMGRSRQLAIDAWNTYGKDCDAFLPYGDESWTPSAYPFSVTHVKNTSYLGSILGLWDGIQLAWLDLADRMDRGELNVRHAQTRVRASPAQISSCHA